MSLRGGSSPSTLAVPVRGKDNRLAAKERRIGDHRNVEMATAPAQTAPGTLPANG